ncbi:MAG TPA: hypothetical protein VMW15_06075 [Terracidiphilus sp.]|nr:hypothetical protein [Terracidiphilus sp.]
MEYIINPYKYRELLMPLCMKLPLTHAVTLTLKPGSQSQGRAEDVWAKYIHHLNKLVWGRNAYDKHKAELSCVAVIQGDRNEHMHLHAAVGSFSQKLSDKEIIKRLKRAANLTDGVWRQRDYGVLHSKDAWLEYITRQIDGTCDEKLLIQHFSAGITPQSHLPGMHSPCTL